MISLSNLQEYKLGTDPTDFDTDDDGVTDNKDDYPTDPTRFKKSETNDKERREHLVLHHLFL